MNYLQKVSLGVTVIVAISLLCVSSCSSSSKSGQNTYVTKTNCSTSPSYDKDIKPLMTTHCVKCHNANKRTDGVALDSYEGTRECFAKGEGLCTVYHDCSPMPRNADKLSNAELEILTCWVKSDCKQ